MGDASTPWARAVETAVHTTVHTAGDAAHVVATRARAGVRRASGVARTVRDRAAGLRHATTGREPRDEPPAGEMLAPSRGPWFVMASAPDCGLYPGDVWRVRQQDGGGRVRIHGGFPVEPGSEFRVALFPDLEHDPERDDSPPPNRDGQRFGVRFVLDDGSEQTLADQHLHRLDGTPFGFRGSCMVGDNWNLLRLDLAPLAGRTVREVLLTNEPGQDGAAWLQVPGVHRVPAEPDDVVERADTRRGSHSAFKYSRGNTLPFVCVPHGFNFLTPLTNARDGGFLYSWHRDGGAHPRLQGLAFCHAPSPWIGDRSAFQLMPWMGGPADPGSRSLGFRHEDEQAHPHRYAVQLEHGVHAEMTATSHAGVFRFRFTGQGPRGVVLDQQIEGGQVRVFDLPDGRAAFEAMIAPQHGWHTRLDNPVPPAYVHGEFSVPGRWRAVTERRGVLAGLNIGGRWLANGLPGRLLRLPLRRPGAAIVEVDADEVEVRVAMSFIGLDQARRNLELEVGRPGAGANEVNGASDTDAFEDVCARAHDQWHALMSRLEVDGGTPDQRQTAWGSLARLFFWPNEHHENTGTAEHPVWRHASPYRPARRHGRRHTGCEVADGRLYVNNGYWDTMRTAWPAYQLLEPERASDLLDGIAQQYREGGWMGRWVGPGYIDCMVGTNSDQVFADAAERGLAFDESTAYDSALRNATVPSSSPLTGRKSIGRARFVGHVDTDEPEGLSWSLENAQCDAAIARWSASLAERARAGLVAPERLAEYEANAVMFAHRALSHAQVFDTRVGFYQGRRPDGGWRVADADAFDPTVWGHDYTETDAWGQAFQAQHDGATLARLLGGEDALAAKLDALLDAEAVTRPAMWGSYTYNTQEMNEAQDAGLGQLAISNQPAHHIPYMYLFAGRPDRTQWLTRELLDTQFVGSEIGQGMPGDEDNGEMSAWWLFTAMGLYPLFPGGPEMVLTAPLFPRLRWTRTDGTAIEVRATGVQHRYVQSVRLNGRPWHEVAVPSRMLQGDVLLEFELGPEPSGWGRDSRPWSASTGLPALAGDAPHEWTPDRTGTARVTGTPHGLAALFDDRGSTRVPLASGDVVEMAWDEPFVVRHLTLTLADPMPGVPVRVEVRRDGAWVDAGVRFGAVRWPDQTVAGLLVHSLRTAEVDGVRFVATAPLTATQMEVY